MMTTCLDQSRVVCNAQKHLPWRDSILTSTGVGFKPESLEKTHLVLGGHVDNAVGVNIEDNLDLGHAARRRRNVHEVELSKQLVVTRHLALALQHLDAHLRRGKKATQDQPTMDVNSLGWQQQMLPSRCRDQAWRPSQRTQRSDHWSRLRLLIVRRHPSEGKSMAQDSLDKQYLH